MNEQLTNEEIDTLMDALKTWEAKDSMGDFMGDLMEKFLVPKDTPEDIRLQLKLDSERRREESKRQANKRREVSVLLQAKLIGLRPPAGEIVRPLR